jgi:hypothetical protein
MSWEKEGVNYWENEDCPKAYLEGSLVRLISEVEGVDLPVDHFKNNTREAIVKEIDFYEYVACK